MPTPSFHSLRTFSLSISTTLILAACGGGGGGGTAATTPAPVDPVVPAVPVNQASIKRVYDGTFSTGASHQTFIFDDNRFYTLYGAIFNGELSVIGVLQGDGVVSGTTYTSINARDYTTAGTVQAATVTATYTAGTSFAGTIAEGGTTYAITATPSVNAQYVYDMPASPVNISGNWSVKDSQGSQVNLVVAADGNLTGTAVVAAGAAAGCAFSGSVKPVATGKNLFDLTLTYSMAPCALAGTSVNGIAMEYLYSNGRRQLVLIGFDAGRTRAATYLGTR
jgi:hypothetical protein